MWRMTHKQKVTENKLDEILEKKKRFLQINATKKRKKEAVYLLWLIFVLNLPTDFVLFLGS